MSKVGDEEPKQLPQAAKLKTRSKKVAALQQSPSTTRPPQAPLIQSITSFSSSSSSSSSSVGASPSEAENNEAISSAADKIRDAGRGSVKGGILDATKAELEFLERRKIAAAILRQFREVEVEKDPMQLLRGRYMPLVFQEASTVNRCRYQAAKVWAKAQERITELKANEVRKKEARKGYLTAIQRWLSCIRSETKPKTTLCSKMVESMKFWNADLSTMECNFGSSMMLTFSFLRWVFFLNFILSWFWMVMVVFPFFHQPPKYFDWTTFRNAFQRERLTNALQGIGIEKSWIYYGGYLYENGEQTGWYHTDYMYPVAIITTLLISLTMVLLRITMRIMGVHSTSFGTSGNVLYPYSTLVFASWDFHVTSFEIGQSHLHKSRGVVRYQAADMMRRGIRMQLRELLADSSQTQRRLSKSAQAQIKRYVALLVLWPLLWAGSVVSVLTLVAYADALNVKYGRYLQPVLFALVNNISPRLTKLLVRIEDWRPATHERVTIMKLYFLRISNLCTIVYRSYSVLWSSWNALEGDTQYPSCLGGAACPDSFSCCRTKNFGEWHLCTADEYYQCVPACTENWVANELLRMIVVTTLLNVAMENFFGFAHLLIMKSKRALDVTDFIVDIVYIQALVWLGSCFSPISSLVGFFCNGITFVGYKVALFYTCVPVEKPYSASRTSNLTYGMLFVTLLLCVIPIAIDFMRASAGFCGPIRKNISMYTVLGVYIQESPQSARRVMDIMSNTWLLEGIIVSLILVLVVVRAKSSQYSKYLSLTKRELRMSRRLARGQANYERLSVDGAHSRPFNLKRYCLIGNVWALFHFGVIYLWSPIYM